MNKTGKGWYEDKFTLTQKDLIAKRYRRGLSIAKLANEFECCRGTIRKTLIDKGMYNPDKTCTVRYMANYDYFNKIDTAEKAYWLGFIAADGCVQVTKKGYSLTISLQSLDREHLSRFLTALSSTHIIKTTIHKAKGKCRKQGTITIYSKKMVGDLIKHGISPRKTKNYEFPYWLKSTLVRHYVRGYFDGDGGWCLQKKKYLGLRIIGLRGFIESLQQVMMNECDLPKNKLLKTKSKNMVRVSYSGGKQCVRLYNWMYHNASVWLPRKKERAILFLKF